MASRTPRSSGRATTRSLEAEDAYPHIPEPKQSHTGSLLAFVSVLAVLGFGFWTALGTFMSGDKPATKPAPSVVVTQSAAATAVPTAAVAGNPTVTPSQSTTPKPSSGRVHVVGPGDTLTKIAQTYGTTVDAIMAANGITDRSHILHVGDKLTIP